MKVLIVGSAPDAMRFQTMDVTFFDQVVVINNAWQIASQWNYCIFPDDFPKERQPGALLDHQQCIVSSQYVPIQNKYGGFVYAGGTMAFTSGYWVLGELKPSLVAYLGCDMIYKYEKTHFYGKGEPDPLRSDPTLMNLKAKSSRLEVLARMQGCDLVNLSEGAESQLVFEKIRSDQLGMSVRRKKLNSQKVNKVLNLEKELGYFIEDGQYWLHQDQFCKKSLSEIDSMWLGCLK